MNITFDWMLHASMVYQILNDSSYLRNQGVQFRLDNYVIYKTGGWTYSPDKIASFKDATKVLCDEAASSTPHFQAICLLQGVSYYSILDKGRELLNVLFPRCYKQAVKSNK